MLELYVNYLWNMNIGLIYDYIVVEYVSILLLNLFSYCEWMNFIMIIIKNDSEIKLTVSYYDL